MAGKTQYYEFTGPVRWAKVWPAQVDRKFATDNAGGNWSLIMTLDDKQQKLYNALGTKTGAINEDDLAILKIKAKKKGKEINAEIGDVTFRRNERHPKLGELGSPAVFGVNEGTSLGNGSVCTVKVEVYPYTFEGQSGNAARLVSVTVNELVEYVKPSTDEDGPPVH
jgi:hypothetical protein